MGSFTEVVPDFDFTADVPDYVLAAFSRLADPRVETADRGRAPELPAPVEEEEFWSPDSDIVNGPESDAPQWAHDWSVIVSETVGGHTVPYARLTWRGQWHLSARFSMKTMPDVVGEMLAWLGAYVDGHWHNTLERPALVGYAHHEYAPRPHLLWWRVGEIELEDLNPDFEWARGNPSPNVQLPPPRDWYT